MSSESYVLLDTKHGLALFFGTNEEMLARKESIRTRCASYNQEAVADSFLRILSQSEVGAVEYDYMASKRLMPRRLLMRLQKET